MNRYTELRTRYVREVNEAGEPTGFTRAPISVVTRTPKTRTVNVATMDLTLRTITCLKEARKFCRLARNRKTLAKIESAIKSAEGALRHQETLYWTKKRSA